VSDTQHPIDVMRGEAPLRTEPMTPVAFAGKPSDDYIQTRDYHRKNYPDQNLPPPETPRPSRQGELQLWSNAAVSDHIDVQHARDNLHHVKAEERQHAQEFWQQTAQAGRDAQQAQRAEKEAEAPVEKPRQPQP
jgi:hypothetical protein